jgi:hypothetical protein
MTRQEANMQIIAELTEFFSKPEHKNVRFFQGLTEMGLFKQQIDDRMNVTGIDDPFHQESTKTLNHITEFTKSHIK